MLAQYIDFAGFLHSVVDLPRLNVTAHSELDELCGIDRLSPSRPGTAMIVAEQTNVVRGGACGPDLAHPTKRGDVLEPRD